MEAKTEQKCLLENGAFKRSKAFLAAILIEQSRQSIQRVSKSRLVCHVNA